jgi:hypothetical protein
MTDVLVEFDTIMRGPNAERYAPRACGREAQDGRWEGWVEFSDIDTGAVVQTERETTQPSRDTTMYWATGLTRVYLEGALVRALENATERNPSVLELIYRFERDER